MLKNINILIHPSMSSVKYYDIHTHKEVDSPDIIQIINLECSELQKLKKGKLFSAGIHPWRVGENFEEQLAKLETLLKSNSIIVIGETGLDKCCQTPFDLQDSVFKKQLELAEKYEKSVIIHCVKAWQEIIEIKKNYQNQQWIVHGFNKNYEQAKSLLAKGFFLSFGSDMFKKSKTIETLKHSPRDKTFLETDTSSANIIELYRKAADIRGIELEKLVFSIEENFTKVFGEKF